MSDFRRRFGREIARVERRRLLRGALSMGALTMLTGCNLADDDAVDRVLWAMLRFNDRVQAALFSDTRLAATFSPAEITRPPKFNAYYPVEKVRAVDAASWKLEVSGRVDDDRDWTLAELMALPRESQITRHICVEGWSQIGQWAGVPLHVFLTRVGADLRARYVSFECFDDYSSSIDMASALHPQTILAWEFDGAPLSPAFGAPLRLRIPTKLGFKNPKQITSIAVTNEYPGGYWEDQGYNWFSGS